MSFLTDVKYNPDDRKFLRNLKTWGGLESANNVLICHESEGIDPENLGSMIFLQNTKMDRRSHGNPQEGKRLSREPL